MPRKRNKASSTDRQRLYVYLTENQKTKLTALTGSLSISNSKYVTKLITKAIKDQTSFDDTWKDFKDEPDFIGNDKTLKKALSGRASKEDIFISLSPTQLETYKHIKALASKIDIKEE